MKEQLTTWATAGDGDCAYKLAQIYRNEGNAEQYRHWLTKSAAAENYFGMKEYAAILLEAEHTSDALELYKKIVDQTCDTEAAEILVDNCGRDRETLEFVLEKMNSMYNEIYLRQGNLIARIFTFGTRRHNEMTMGTWYAIERCRIAEKIRKLLAE